MWTLQELENNRKEKIYSALSSENGEGILNCYVTDATGPKKQPTLDIEEIVERKEASLKGLLTECNPRMGPQPVVCGQAYSAYFSRG